MSWGKGELLTETCNPSREQNLYQNDCRRIKTQTRWIEKWNLFHSSQTKSQKLSDKRVLKITTATKATHQHNIKYSNKNHLKNLFGGSRVDLELFLWVCAGLCYLGKMENWDCCTIYLYLSGLWILFSFPFVVGIVSSVWAEYERRRVSEMWVEDKPDWGQWIFLSSHSFRNSEQLFFFH